MFLSDLMKIKINQGQDMLAKKSITQSSIVYQLICSHEIKVLYSAVVYYLKIWYVNLRRCKLERILFI